MLNSFQVAANSASELQQTLLSACAVSREMNKAQPIFFKLSLLNLSRLISPAFAP